MFAVNENDDFNHSKLQSVPTCYNINAIKRLVCTQLRLHREPHMLLHGQCNIFRGGSPPHLFPLQPSPKKT